MARKGERPHVSKQAIFHNSIKNVGITTKGKKKWKKHERERTDMRGRGVTHQCTHNRGKNSCMGNGTLTG